MAALSGNPDFDLFTLSDEHKELRAVLRHLCEKEIAPYAADVDEKARYTDEALAALTSSRGSPRSIFPRSTAGRVGTRWRAASSSKRSRGCARPRR